jgi:hypothetical protein
MPAKKKIGRPRRTNGRTLMVGVRLDATERRRFEDAAELERLELSAWIRLACELRANAVAGHVEVLLNNTLDALNEKP